MTETPFSQIKQFCNESLQFSHNFLKMMNLFQQIVNFSLTFAKKKLNKKIIFEEKQKY